MDFYVWDRETGEVKIEDNFSVFNKFFLDVRNSRLAENTVGTSWISTVFLGFDHSHQKGGNPILWETIVFDGPLAGEMERYCTMQDAIAGHYQMVERVREAENALNLSTNKVSS